MLRYLKSTHMLPAIKIPPVLSSRSAHCLILIGIFEVDADGVSALNQDFLDDKQGEIIIKYRVPHSALHQANPPSDGVLPPVLPYYPLDF